MTIDQRALTAACEELGVRLLVLFGSRAPGGLTPGDDSDIDVAVAFHPGTPRRGHFEVYGRLSDGIRDGVLDLVLLADADPLFRWEIMERAVLLYGDAIDFLEYRAFAFRDFIDSASLRRLERTLLDRKLQRIRTGLRAAS